MNHQVGDSVKNTEEKNYSNGDNIAVGTRGTVRRVYHLSKSYLVRFQGAAMDHRVPESDLARC